MQGESEGSRSDEYVELTITNVPEQVAEDFQNLAKYDYGEDYSALLKDAINKLVDSRSSRIERLESQVSELEGRVGVLETDMRSRERNTEEEKDEGVIKTLGGEYKDPSVEEDDVDEAFDKIEEY